MNPTPQPAASPVPDSSDLPAKVLAALADPRAKLLPPNVRQLVLQLAIVVADQGARLAALESRTP